ncbi:MAG TPA: riboflavin synthase [Jatrophihabitans sp.]
MFTGIVETLGEVVGIDRRAESAVLRIAAPAITDDLVRGASIAVNGVCLTVVDWSGTDQVTIDFDVMGETLARSVLGGLQVGDPVNLERATRADARLDGHIVQGHVDGTARIVTRTPGDAWETVRFDLPTRLARYVAEKGSIAVDGVSLTVAGVGDDWFEVGLIPQTLRTTTLGARRPGDSVNLEVDVLAKYVERLMKDRNVG